MSVRLAELLTTDGRQNADLHRVMLMCQTEAQIVYIVCCGAGDAFIARYWPTLRKYAARKRLHLLIADRKPLKELAQEKVQRAIESGEVQAAETLEKLYGELVNTVERQNNVIYVNVEDENDRRWYEHIRADIVLVLVPDHVHLRVASQWIKRSTLILIEKPYNRDLPQAIEFEEQLSSMMRRIGVSVPLTRVWAFDHYLAKIAEYVFKKERDQLFDRIGQLVRIEFGILEAGPIEAWRAESLRAGMIYDLFSHVLAMISVELDLSSFRVSNIKRIAVARHKLPEFSGDTFAYFDFDLLDDKGRPTNVLGSVGKGVGKQDEKFLTFVGEFGAIKCELDSRGSKHILITEHRKGKAEDPIYDVRQGHQEFLETLLTGKFIEEPIGGLTGETAIQILHIMNTIRDRIPGSIYGYDVGDSKLEITKHATDLRFW